ncbi:phage tail tape measure protein [Roseobacter sp. HKCCA0434]|uniref:phage tail tape measure protein n=1 Tax=Roseobacter sp. HKCCA0434 TaxID=3079297 RepID=UPI002905D4EA|nr:phage tail tape measure protein [Roseobacter sp. HKCCA0434]
MTDRTEVEELFAEVDASIASTEAVTEAFRRELEATGRTLENARGQVSGLDRAMGRGLRAAFDDLVFDGARAGDAMRNLGRAISGSVLDQALKPIQNAVGGALSGLVETGLGALLPFAKGGAFSGGRPTAFAKGGVVSGPTTFPMRGGTGLMGEAGPEAIMPLTRGPDGALGVKAQSAGGSGAVNVVMNISTPDAEGFRRSRTQIAAEMSRAMSRGRRNM